jgi:hypothetical protein
MGVAETKAGQQGKYPAGPFNDYFFGGSLKSSRPTSFSPRSRRRKRG